MATRVGALTQAIGEFGVIPGQIAPTESATEIASELATVLKTQSISAAMDNFSIQFLQPSACADVGVIEESVTKPIAIAAPLNLDGSSVSKQQTALAITGSFFAVK